MKVEVGKIYLTLDPTKHSDDIIDFRRLWVERIAVQVTKVHPLRIRNRYDVRTAHGIEFSTGRLSRVKPTSQAMVR